VPAWPGRGGGGESGRGGRTGGGLGGRVGSISGPIHLVDLMGIVVVEEKVLVVPGEVDHFL